MNTSPIVSPKLSPMGWMLLLALSLLWGGAFFFVGVAVKVLPPLSVVALRVGLAALALLAWLVISGHRIPLAKSVLAAFVVMGILNNLVPFTLLAWGQTQISSALASILNATTPLFTVLVAHGWTVDEKITKARLAGVLAGLAGVAVMLGPEALGGIVDNIYAQLACLGAALSYAVAGVFGRRLRGLGVRPIDAAAGQLTASAILLTPVALLIDRPWTLAMPGIDVWLAIISLALASTSLAYIIYFRLLETAGATNLMLVTLIIPVSATFLGVSFLDEVLAPEQILGMALIGLGLVIIDGRLIARIRT